ncbi:MAG: hypothetical protein P8Y47_11135 [Alphaproteobacteria bacterium]
MPAEMIIFPDAKAIATLSKVWRWLFPKNFQPFLFGALGDMFFEVLSGEVFCLNAGVDAIERGANR